MPVVTDQFIFLLRLALLRSKLTEIQILKSIRLVAAYRPNAWVLF